MKILRIIRRPYLSIFMAALILFVSCNQYEPIRLEERKFDYTVFEEFKSGNYDVDLTSIQNSNDTNTNKFKAVVKKVNLELNTNISLPDQAYDLVNYNADEVYSISLKNGWMSQEDVVLSKKLTDDIIKFGFETAISNYEEDVMTMSLTNEEFARKNAFLNVMRSKNFKNPEVFNQSKSDKSISKISCGWCSCAAASVSVVAAFVSFGACVTIVACGLAVVLMYAAVDGFVTAC